MEHGTYLYPNIERRLSAWLNFQERGRKLSSTSVEGPSKLAITISREYGCEGYPLAEALKSIFEEKTRETWTIFDRALLEMVRKDPQVSQMILENARDADIGDASHYLDKLSVFIPNWVTHDELYQTLTKYIIQLARKGNAIIIGRGGAILTQGLPNCYHFRLVAPLEFRIQSIANRMNIPIQEAKKVVLDNQNVREKFIEDYLQNKTSDPQFYHAIFNNQKTTVNVMAQSIFQVMAPALEEQLSLLTVPERS